MEIIMVYRQNVATVRVQSATSISYIYRSRVTYIALERALPIY